MPRQSNSTQVQKYTRIGEYHTLGPLYGCVVPPMTGSVVYAHAREYTKYYSWASSPRRPRLVMLHLPPREIRSRYIWSAT